MNFSCTKLVCSSAQGRKLVKEVRYFKEEIKSLCNIGFCLWGNSINNFLKWKQKKNIQLSGNATQALKELGNSFLCAKPMLEKLQPHIELLFSTKGFIFPCHMCPMPQLLTWINKII